MIPPRVKIAGLYVNSVLAKTEATLAGFDEAILLTNEGYVSEGAGENIFIVSNGKLVTPAISDNILGGITREAVIQLAKNELGLETVERSVRRSELYTADECFLTGDGGAPDARGPHRQPRHRHRATSAPSRGSSRTSTST